MATPSCVLTCDFGSEGVTLAVFERQDGKAMRCSVVHSESYSSGTQQQQQQQPQLPTIDTILQAFQRGMDWLSARASMRNVSTMSFTSSLYLPVLLTTNVQHHLSSNHATTKSLHAIAKDVLALSSDRHATLLWSSHDEAKTITALENALAVKAGVNVIDPVCQTALSTLCAEEEVTRKEFQRMQAGRTGTTLSASTLPVRLVKMTECLQTMEAKALWENVGAVSSLPGLVIALLTGSVPRPGTMEATQTGCWDIRSCKWDEDLLQVSTDRVRMHCERGGEGHSPRLAGNFLAPLLGHTSNESADSAPISPTMASRFNLPATCKISTDVLPSLIASYLSHLPNYNDLGIQLGAHEDWLILPTSAFVPDIDRIVVPNPAHTTDSSAAQTQPYLTLCRMTGAGEARLAVRNRYTNGNWSAFGRMMGVVCAGGTVGMDNKYFTIHSPAEPLDPNSSNLKRYEGGTRVVEFSDLRANTRCLIEGQGATIRAFVGRVLTSDRRSSDTSPLIPQFSTSVDFANGTHKYNKAHSPNQFDPYDIALSPLRILAWSNEEEIGAHSALAECLTNIVGGRWVSVTNKNRGASGSASANIRAEDASAWKGLGARQQVQGRPMAYPPPAAHHGRGPSQESLLASILAAQEQPLTDVALDQVPNRALVGCAFFALAMGASERKTFNEYGASLLTDGKAVTRATEGDEPHSARDGSGSSSPSTPSPTRTRARSSSSPLMVNLPPSAPALPGYRTSPTVSFDVPDSSPNTPRRRAVSTSITPASVGDDIRRRRSASSLSMQAAAARQGVLSFSIAEEGEEEGSGGGSSSAAGSSLGGVCATRERSQSTSGENPTGSAAPPLRNRAVSMMAGTGETSLGRRASKSSTDSKSTPVSTSASRLTRMSSSSSVGSVSSRAAIVSSPIDDDDTPHERAMRAWLQGQLSEPPPEPGSFPPSSSESEQLRTPTTSTLSSPTHSRSSSFAYAPRERSISLSSGTVPSSPPMGLAPIPTPTHPPTPIAAQRLESIYSDNATNEELLGLKTMAKADEDVWMVYGALSEEYLRLKSWTGGLQGSLGELASSW